MRRAPGSGTTRGCNPIEAPEPPPPRVLVAVAVATAGWSCNGDDDDDDAAGATTVTSGADTTTTGAESTTTTGPTVELVRCSNPDGFSLSYPGSWEQDGCSAFHPEPFEPPGATDERGAAITAYVDPVAFDVATDPDNAQDLERATLEIDGRPAARLSYRIGGESLHPEGTPITFYAVDLGPGADGRARTLFVDTIGLTGFDYDGNVQMLERMAPTVEFAA